MADPNYQFTEESNHDFDMSMFNQYPYDQGNFDLSGTGLDSINQNEDSAQQQFGTNLDNYSTSLGSLSNASSPSGYYSGSNNSNFDQQRNSASPHFNDFSASDNYSNPGNSFQPGAYFRSAAIKRTTQSNPPQSLNYSNSLSPPDSATSASSWHGQQSAYPPTSTESAETEMMARMIAEAHRYPSDPTSVMDLKRSASQAYTTPQYAPTAGTIYGNQDALFSGFPSQTPKYLLNGAQQLENGGEMDPKRRRTTGPAPIPVRSTAPTPARALKKQSPPPNLLPHQQANLLLNKDGNPFQFSIHSNLQDSVITGMGTGRNTAALNIISNAGLQDRTNFRDDSIGNASARNGVNRPVSANADYAPKNKAAEKKGKKGEKKKKGEKGHNAVERRYRNNINNHIATLRDIVPALRHLKPLPSMPASRRRASQFTLSTGAQAPTPAGLIDGIPAAKTLSKGTILGKSIEYIQYLQYARHYGGEDLEMLMSVIQEFVGGSEILIETFEQRRSIREIQREKDRESAIIEQDRMDREDGSEGEEEEEEEDVPTPPKAVRGRAAQATATSKKAAAAQEALVNGRTKYYESPPGKFPPSPVSSNDELSTLSSTSLLQQRFQGDNQNGQSRILLATFMGVSFAAGGYDWTVSNVVQDPSTAAPRAWAGSLIKKAGVNAFVPIPSSGLVSTGIINSTAMSALVFLGLVVLFASIVFLVLPLFNRSTPIKEERKTIRERRRMVALHALKNISTKISNSPATYESEIAAAVSARKELLTFVGAPTSYHLLPAIAREMLATALCMLTSVRVGSFESWSKNDREEIAAAWIRIIEIETSIGHEFSFLSKSYTFIRLYNLSRSSHWPQSSSSTATASVNALLGLHLANLGAISHGNSLWNLSSADRKKSVIELDQWVEIAISTEFTRARAILAVQRVPEDVGERSDTSPLLRISEVRCEAALRESWAKIFVAVVQTTCTSATEGDPIENIVDRDLLEETIEHVLASTVVGSSVHSLARITKAVSVYDGSLVELQRLSRKEIVVNPISPVAILASTTIRWLKIRRESVGIKGADPILHAESLAIRRLLSNSIFGSPELRDFCQGSFDLDMAHENCVDAVAAISRAAAGLFKREESDSGVDL